MNSKPSEDLDFSSEFNEVEYSCQECGKNWNSKEFMEEYDENYSEYDTWVRGDWSSIMSSIIGNMFKYDRSLTRIACPKCSLETDSGGEIKVRRIGLKTNPKWLIYLYNNKKLHLDMALANAPMKNKTCIEYQGVPENQ